MSNNINTQNSQNTPLPPTSTVAVNTVSTSAKTDSVAVFGEILATSGRYQEQRESDYQSYENQQRSEQFLTQQTQQREELQTAAEEARQQQQWQQQEWELQRDAQLEAKRDAQLEQLREPQPVRSPEETEENLSQKEQQPQDNKPQEEIPGQKPEEAAKEDPKEKAEESTVQEEAADENGEKRDGAEQVVNPEQQKKGNEENQSELKSELEAQIAIEATPKNESEQAEEGPDENETEVIDDDYILTGDWLQADQDTQGEENVGEELVVKEEEAAEKSNKVVVAETESPELVSEEKPQEAETEELTEVVPGAVLEETQAHTGQEKIIQEAQASSAEAGPTGEQKASEKNGKELSQSEEVAAIKEDEAAKKPSLAEARHSEAKSEAANTSPTTESQGTSNQTGEQAGQNPQNASQEQFASQLGAATQDTSDGKGSDSPTAAEIVAAAAAKVKPETSTPAQQASTTQPAAIEAKSTNDLPATQSSFQSAGAAKETAKSELPERVDQTKIVNRVMRAIESMVQRGDNVVRMRLAPPELGALRLELRVEDGKMNAKIETETKEAHKAITENLGQLKERLEQRNITIERIEISHNDQFNSQAGFERSNDWDATQSQRDGSGSSSEQADEKTAESELAASENNEFVNESSVNVLA